MGDGAGYYLDATPNNWSEFTCVVNDFLFPLIFRHCARRAELLGQLFHR